MPRRSHPFVKALAVVSLVVVGLLYLLLVFDVFRNDGKPLTTLSPKGPQAKTIQDLNIPLFAIAGVVFVLVFGVVLFITWRFRSRHDEDEDEEMPAQLHGNTALEIGWTLLPALILAAVAVFTVITILDLEKRSPEALKVEVYGQQWWWQFKYDTNGDGEFGDVTTAGEMVIPVGREVDLEIRSNDVIHSFWIPALNGKKDAVPGITNHWKFEASEPGVYRGQCTEYCGLSHANMRMLVRALSPDDYERWLANQLRSPRAPAAGSAADAGKTVFGQMCAQCHVVRGQFEKAQDTAPPLVSGVAPNLTHLMTRGTFVGSIYNLYAPQDPADPTKPGDPSDTALAGDPGEALYGGDSAPYPFNRSALEAWLRNPPAMKPAYAQGQRGMPNLGLSEAQIDSLVAYLETLE